MKKVFFGLMALAIASVAVVSSNAASKKFVTVYWFNTTNNPLASADESTALVDPDATPFEGNESSTISGCTQSNLYCAKGFIASQVDPITHQPANSNSPATYYRYKN